MSDDDRVFRLFVSFACAVDQNANKFPWNCANCNEQLHREEDIASGCDFDIETKIYAEDLKY